MYSLLRARQSLSSLDMCLATLHVGVLMLLVTGWIGMPGLCNLRRAFNVGGVGCFWMRYLTCLFIMELHLCKICYICFWHLSVGFVWSLEN
jgi:hypothetical protein